MMGRIGRIMTTMSAAKFSISEGHCYFTSDTVPCKYKK